MECHGGNALRPVFKLVFVATLVFNGAAVVLFPAEASSQCEWPHCSQGCDPPGCKSYCKCAGYEPIKGGDNIASQCDAGWSGDVCVNECYSHCKEKACLNSLRCIGYQGGKAEPASHCKTGFYSSTCVNSCPSNCAEPGCTKDGKCIGYYGTNVSSPAKQCKPGYYGSTCVNSCPSQCAVKMCRNELKCIGYDSCTGPSPATHCKQGFYGSGCFNKCPSECSQPGCTVNGNCIGYNSGGPKSPASQCKTGYYGAGCFNKCYLAGCKHGCLKDGSCAPFALADNTSPDRRSVPTGNCSVPTPTKACTEPNGTSSCSFYSDCLEASHSCGASGYVQSYGLPYCEKFLKLDHDSTVPVNVRDWFRGVRQCLQSEAVPWVYDPSLSCQDLSARAFASHPKCYTAAGNSICNNLNAARYIVQTIGMDALTHAGTTFQIGATCARALAWRAWSGISNYFKVSLAVSSSDGGLLAPAIAPLVDLTLMIGSPLHFAPTTAKPRESRDSALKPDGVAGAVGATVAVADALGAADAGGTLVPAVLGNLSRCADGMSMVFANQSHLDPQRCAAAQATLGRASAVLQNQSRWSFELPFSLFLDGNRSTDFGQLSWQVASACGSDAMSECGTGVASLLHLVAIRAAAAVQYN